MRTSFALRKVKFNIIQKAWKAEFVLYTSEIAKSKDKNKKNTMRKISKTSPATIDTIIKKWLV